MYRISKVKINMVYLKLLLSLIFIVSMTLVIAEVSIGLKKDVTPEHYNIKFAAYINDNKFYGECNVSIRVHEPTHIINLYSDKLYIIDMTLIDNLETSDKNVEINVSKPTYFYVNDTDILNLHFTNKILSGHYILSIKFMGAMSDYNGVKIFNKKKYENIPLAVSHLRYGARQIFPCWDEPSFHTTFNISILYHNNYKVLSNMPVKKEEADENGMLWTHFDTTPAMPTYLVAVVIINKLNYRNVFDQRSSDNHIFYRTKNLKSLLYVQQVIEHFTQFLYNRKNLRINSKVDHVIIQNFHDEDIMNLGFIYYRESDVTYNDTSDVVVTKFEITRLVGYKIAQVLFYNVLNTRWCNTPWLYEAFVSFFGILVTDEAFEVDFRMMDLFVVKIQHEVFHLDVDFNISTSHDKNFSLEILPLKGTILLRTIYHVIGDKLLDLNMFCMKDNSYYWENNYDFWTVLATANNFEQVPSQEELHSKIEKAKQMRSWVKQKLFVLKVTRNYDADTAINEVTIEILNTTETDLIVPVTYTTETRLNFNDTEPATWLTIEANKANKAHIQNISDFNSTDWIIFNLKQTGYYRVNYDEGNWDKIIEYLNSKDYKNIHVLNRAQLITDAYHLMVEHQLDPSKFWDLVSYLRQEIDYVAWHPMFKALEYMSSIFLLAKYDEGVNSTTTKIRSIIYEAKEKHIKFKNNPYNYPLQDKTLKCFEEETEKWACLLGDEKCLKNANSLLQTAISNLTNKILPGWKKWTFCNGLVSSSNSLWNNVYDMWRKNSDYKISSFFSLDCAEDVNIITKYLDFLNGFMTKHMSKYYYLRLQVANNFLSTIAKHVSTAAIFEHVLNNFEKIIPREIGEIATIIVIINHLYTKEQLDDFYTFIIDYMYDQVKEMINAQEDKINDRYNIPISHQINERPKVIFEKIQNKMEIRRAEIKNLNKYIKIFIPKSY